jgi:DinB family protein
MAARLRSGPSPAALAAWRRRAVRQMTRSRSETLELLRRIPAEALGRPRTQGAWSVRDVLAHVAAWEAEGARRLALIARGRGERIVWYDTPAELDAFNARAVSVARRLAPGAVLRRLAAARGRLLAGLRRLPPSALADPGHALPVTRWLREFAWTHEAAHRRAIRAWSRGRPAVERRP